MSALDDSMLQRMLSESVHLGSGLFGSEHVVVDRALVLAQHGVSREEDARQFDEFVLRLGGSLRRVRRIEGGVVWVLPRAVLERVQPPEPLSGEGDSLAASS